MLTEKKKKRFQKNAVECFFINNSAFVAAVIVTMNQPLSCLRLVSQTGTENRLHIHFLYFSLYIYKYSSQIIL